MKASHFTKNAPGRLVPTLARHDAFLPNPLPPQLVWTQALASAQSAADLALGRLSGVGQSLTNPHLLIRPFLRREAVLSSRIEGTHAELSDLFLFEASESVENSVPDVREVHNYVTALEHGLVVLKKRPLGLNQICDLHRILMRNVRGRERTPGQFRKRQNWIGRGQCAVQEARYVPPPPEELMQCLDAFEKYVHAPSDLPPLIRLALIHYQFEAIHPFIDGNGRLGRLLISLLLCAEELLPQPLLYLSAYLERNQTEYFDHLLNVSQRGNWTEWAIFFLRGVTEQATDAVQRSNRLLKLRDGYRRKVQTSGRSARLLELVDHLFTAPAIRVTDAQRVLKITPRAALTNVNRLVELRILREITGQPRNRIFAAEEIMRTVDERSGALSPLPRMRELSLTGKTNV